jgi:hypothetical protein
VFLPCLLACLPDVGDSSPINASPTPQIILSLVKNLNKSFVYGSVEDSKSWGNSGMTFL